MSLAIVAVTPAGIVLGVDSAITSKSQGREYSLAGFPKIVNRHGAVQAIAFVGDLQIGEPGRESWINEWIQMFLGDVASSMNAKETAAELADALNTEALPNGQYHELILAAWEGPEEDRWPTVWEVSTGLGRGEYAARRLLNPKDVDKIVKAQQQAGPEFPVIFFHAGVPSGLASWLLDEARSKFVELLDAAIPAPNVEGVEEFVRFILKIAADLYSLAASQRYVNGPFTTTVLLPSGVNKMTWYR